MAKIFNGKKYLTGGFFSTKKQAQTEANRYRESGYTARVIQETATLGGKGYMVYYSYKR